MELRKFMQIVTGSKQYEFHGPILEVTGYYTGERVKLDLSKMDEEMLEALLAGPEDEEEDGEWQNENAIFT